MGVEFVNITVSTEGLYATATRAFGAVAIVGDGGTVNTTPIKIGNYSEASTAFGVTDLGIGVKNALRNGAAYVWAVDCGTPTLASVQDALESLEGIDIQVVALAGIVETADNAYISNALANHLDSAMTERIGVFQLGKAQDATTMPTTFAGLVTANRSRLFGIAHNSDDEVACAAAGLIAGLKPEESPLLKPLTNVSQTVGFTSAQIAALETAHINVLVSPIYMSGNSFVLGSDYTMGSTAGGINFIDTRRVIDDIAYKLKAGLTSPSIIGTVRVNQPGLSIMRGRIAGILQNCLNSGEIDEYVVKIPLLDAMKKDPSARSDAENTLISGARTSRGVSCDVSITYGGVLHVINIDVKITA